MMSEDWGGACTTECPFCGAAGLDLCQHNLAGWNDALGWEAWPFGQRRLPELAEGVDGGSFTRAQLGDAFDDLLPVIDEYDKLGCAPDYRLLLDALLPHLGVPVRVEEWWQSERMCSGTGYDYYAEDVSDTEAEIEVLLGRLDAGFARLTALAAQRAGCRRSDEQGTPEE